MNQLIRIFQITRNCHWS